jgi:hypothetical protein
MRAPSICLFSLVVSATAVLSACGSGSGMQSPPPAPVFTSTPGTAASQGVLYSYQVAATDPAGGTVSFTLTSAPASATLSGNALSWTPAATQSRVSNRFTVTATTTSGGSGTQSWSVTPTGTITVSVMNTNWTSTGPQTSPDGFPLGSAIVPNGDGSFTVIPGSFTAPGIFSIPTVPAGYYWLASGINLTGLFDAIWTSSSRVDLGRDIPGPPTALTTKQSTTFNFNIAGLAPTSTSSLVDVSTDFPPILAPGFLLSPAPEATTASGTTTVDGIVDWSKVDTVFLTQYEPASLGSLNLLELGSALTLSNPAFVDGGTNAITETLQSSPQASLSVSVPGSQWVALSSNVGPSAAAASGSWLSISAEPFVIGVNQSPDPFALNLPLVTVPPFEIGPPQLFPDFCLNGPADPLGIPSTQPPILTDENFGVLSYSDPFPPSWTRAVAFCQSVAVLIPVVGSLETFFPFELPYGVAVPPSSSPSLAPLAEPVQNPTLNGASLFTESTINTTLVTLTWSAPQGATPYGYRITAFTQTPLAGGVEYASAGEFATAKTSVTLPPLSAGQAYVFIITTAVDAAANMETSPWRSALPTGFANVISAPVTISSGASMPTIHGDAKLFAELSRRRGKAFTPGFASRPAPRLGGIQ